ncbi:MAG: hypothetical protein ACRC2R_05670 [Xenococcaceae cyanobacterium]
MTSRRNWQLAAFSEDTDNSGQIKRLKSKLESFVNSLGNVLDEMTAIEINTAIVDEITGDEFIPWEVYRDFYPISRNYLEEIGIHFSLRDRYLTLRKKLEFEYALLLTDPNSDLYEPDAFSELRTEFPILTNSTAEWEASQTKLPSPFPPSNPETLLKVQKLLVDSRFLRKLRQIGELKLLLDSRNKTLLQAEENVQDAAKVNGDLERLNNKIYAKTIIQLDGNIINRYSQEILHSPHQELLLEIHKSSIKNGERQWRVLINFVIEMIQKLLATGKHRKKAKVNLKPENRRNVGVSNKKQLM